MHTILLALTAAALGAVVWFVHRLLAGAPPIGLTGRLRLLPHLLGLQHGAISLAEAAKLSDNELQRGVIEVFREESPLMDLLRFIPIQGNGYTYNKEATLPGVAFRGVNEAYTESTGTVVPVTETLKILGGDADVDRFVQQTMSNINDQRATQTRMKVKAARLTFQDAFFNGDSAVEAREFDGLKKRLTGGQVIDTATNGMSVLGTTDAERHAFLDKLDEMLAQVRGPVAALFLNKGILGSLRSSARRLGKWDTQRDDFGRKVDYYDGIPLLDPGDDAVGGMILPQDETQGTADDCSSIYAIALSEDEAEHGVAGLTNGGIQAYDLGEVDDKPAYRTRIEFYAGIATFGLGAARLRGVRK